MNDLLDERDDGPVELFERWLKQAGELEVNDPNAAALATATPEGVPSVRMVLAKRIGDHPFCFFTNAESRKGRDLAENPRAALCFHWKTLRRQIRVEGSVVRLEDAASDAYFHSRSRASQIGAAVSRQSRPLESREKLEEEFRAYSERHTGEVARPDFWRGFELIPERIEFWISGADRLHDRWVFTREGENWGKVRLYP